MTVLYFNLCCCLTIGLIMLLSIRPVDCAKQCYACKSNKSLEDCEDKQTADIGCEDILNSTSTCYIVEAQKKEGSKTFGKHCIAKEKCTKKYICEPGSVCELTCCTTPLCNMKRKNKFSSSATPSPTLLLLLCATVLALRAHAW